LNFNETITRRSDRDELHVLAYNLKRAINIHGVPKIIEQLQTA
jgi:hypothetical protein